MFRRAILLCAAIAAAQTGGVTTRLERPGAPLYATIGGGEKKIADSAEKAWVVGDGQAIVYSGKDGAGGYEHEGQSLYRYDVKSGDRAKLMAEYFVVQNVKEARTSDGKPALLVDMVDGGMGASHVAVVDPARGEVFCEDGARLTSVQGDTMTLAYYGDDDWDALNDNQEVKPQKTETYDLRQVLTRAVMKNNPN